MDRYRDPYRPAELDNEPVPWWLPAALLTLHLMTVVLALESAAQHAGLAWTVGLTFVATASAAAGGFATATWRSDRKRRDHEWG